MHASAPSHPPTRAHSCADMLRAYLRAPARARQHSRPRPRAYVPRARSRTPRNPPPSHTHTHAPSPPPSDTAKVLTFDLHVGAASSGTVIKPAAPGSPVPAGVVTAADDSTAAQAATLRVFARRLSNSLRDVLDAVTYHRARATRHHETLLSTEARVGAWTLVESLGIAAFAAAQIVVVMGWFSSPPDASSKPPSTGMFSARRTPSTGGFHERSNSARGLV